MSAWLHAGLSTERLEHLRLWALHCAEQSREYGESPEVWGGYLDTADRVTDLLDLRAGCRTLHRLGNCSSVRLRAPESERKKRNGCFFPLCLIANRRIPPGHIRFNFNN
jgi:hypothetical protein